jgi:hypothetical protein
MSGLRGTAQVIAPSAYLVATSVVFCGNGSCVSWQRELCLVATGVL